MALVFYKTESVLKWRLEELDAIIDEFDAAIEAAIKKIGPKEAHDYLNVILGASGKSIVTFREIVILSAFGYPDGALSLARNLYEQFILLSFFESKQEDHDFQTYIEDYFLHDEIQRLRALKFEARACRDNTDDVTRIDNELLVIGKKAHHEVKANDYWWSGFQSFAAIYDYVCNKNLSETGLKRWIGVLHFLYKRACISLHASALGNTIRLGDSKDSNVIDTSPRLEGMNIPLQLATVSFIFIVGITCRELNIDFNLFQDRLNELAIFYQSYDRRK